MNNLQKPLSEEQKANLHELGKNTEWLLENYRFKTLPASYLPQICRP